MLALGDLVTRRQPRSEFSLDVPQSLKLLAEESADLDWLFEPAAKLEQDEPLRNQRRMHGGCSGRRTLPSHELDWAL